MRLEGAGGSAQDRSVLILLVNLLNFIKNVDFEVL